MTAIPARLPTASLSSYWYLLKPRVMSLVIFTGLCGMLLAPASINRVVQFTALLSLAMGAGGAGCLNMWVERYRDSLMTRTRNRPLPSGLINPDSALSLGMILSVSAPLIMGLIVNVTAAFLLAFTIIFYVLIYTILLKPWTEQNIVIGGISGALPPVIGWASVTGDIPIQAWSLFLIIFLWTPAHFWSLCLACGDDYANAGIPMMPQVRGERITKKKILHYTIVTIVSTYLPYYLDMVSKGYLMGVSLLGIILLTLATAVYHQRQQPLRLFWYSILYLFLIFINLVIFAT